MSSTSLQYKLVSNENLKLCHIINYMTVLFVYELNVFTCVNLLCDVFKKEKNEKEET